MRRLGETLEFGARGARAVAGLGDLIAQLRLVHHLLDIAQALRPLAVFVAGERAGFAARTFLRAGAGAGPGLVEQVRQFIRALTALARLRVLVLLLRRFFCFAGLLRCLWIVRLALTLALPLTALGLLRLLRLLILLRLLLAGLSLLTLSLTLALLCVLRLLLTLLTLLTLLALLTGLLPLLALTVLRLLSLSLLSLSLLPRLTLLGLLLSGLLALTILGLLALLPLTLLTLLALLSGLLSLLSVLSLRGGQLRIVGAACSTGDSVGSRT